MKRLLLITAVVITAVMLTGCPGDNTEEIVVIIEDATFNGGENNGTEDNHPPPEDTNYTEPVDTLPVKDTSETAPEVEERRMTLTGTVALLKRDLEREDVARLTRHTEALDKAITGELEKAGEGGRKRTLNLFSIKLGSFKRTVGRLEDEDIPDETKAELEEKLAELTDIAKRIEGK